VTIRYEIIEESGAIASCIDRGPLHMYCTSRHRLQGQLAEAGFKAEGVYSDFLNTPYEEDSEEIHLGCAKELGLLDVLIPVPICLFDPSGKISY